MNRIRSIMLVKNEADVIESCLNDAMRWSDFIYVYDNGSDDGTWEIVQSMRSEQIIPVKQNWDPFSDGMRAEVFNRYKGQCSEGDWWCRLDAHEFYIDDPRKFVESIPRHQHIVWGLFVQYYLTHEDLDEIDFSRPCSEVLPKLRYYSANYGEPRFFRHRDNLTWNDSDAWPRHLGVPSKKVIRFKHYPYRSPAQVEMRLAVRRHARARGAVCGIDSPTELDWRLKLASRAGLTLDANDGNYNVDMSALNVHIGSNYRRIAQSLMHQLGFWA